MNLDILKERRYTIIEVEKNKDYIFYNGVRHFACRLDYLTLNILNLVYVYKDKEIILSNIDKKHHHHVIDILTKIEEAKMLSLEDDDNKFNYADSPQMPSQFYLHITYDCNLGCTYCYNKDIRIHKNSLKLEDWHKLLDKILPHAKLIVLTGGEPFLRKDIEQIVDYIKDNKPEVIVEIISNCMHDFESGQFDNVFSRINGISFSCDDLTKERQERKNFKPERFIKNIKYIKHKYPNLYIGISSTFIKNSEGALDELIEFSRENDCRPRSVLVIPNNEEEMHLLPTIEDYRKRLMLEPVKSKLRNKQLYCGAGFGLCSLDPLGNAYPCQNMHYDEFLLGNLLEQSVQDIFQSKETKKWRAGLSIENIPECNECNIKYICGAGCRAATFRLEKGVLNFPKILCEYYRTDAMQKLACIP